MDPLPTILVIDDAADSCRLIVAYLRVQGFTVESAADGASGIERALEHRPDLVITDLLMPDHSGYRVLSLLRSDPAYQPKVIMISAHDADTQQAYAAAMGADDFLTKPFVLQQLLDSVRRLFPATTQALAGAEDPSWQALIRQ